MFSELKNNTVLIDVVTNHVKLQSMISQTLLPILEKWSGQKISSDPIIYGIRRYLRGAWCQLHVDRLPTHILSVILQVCIQNKGADQQTLTKSELSYYHIYFSDIICGGNIFIEFFFDPHVTLLH